MGPSDLLDENLLRPHDDPPRKSHALFADERAAIDHFHSEVQPQSPCIYLISASGLDLTNADEHLRGPHVGGQAHMLIKHSIFKTSQPVVLFLDDAKLKKPFQPEKCFPVFGPDYPLKSICETNPIAVCLGSPAPSQSRVRGPTN
jgi:hypothetical protein